MMEPTLLPLSSIPRFALEPGDRIEQGDVQMSVAMAGIHILAHDVLTGQTQVIHRQDLGFCSLNLRLPSVRDRLGRAIYAALFPDAEQPFACPIGVGAEEIVLDCPPGVRVPDDDRDRDIGVFVWRWRSEHGVAKVWPRTLTPIPDFDGDDAPLLALAALTRQVFG